MLLREAGVKYTCRKAALPSAVVNDRSSTRWIDRDPAIHKTVFAQIPSRNSGAHYGVQSTKSPSGLPHPRVKREVYVSHGSSLVAVEKATVARHVR